MKQHVTAGWIVWIVLGWIHSPRDRCDSPQFSSAFSGSIQHRPGLAASRMENSHKNVMGSWNSDCDFNVTGRLTFSWKLKVQNGWSFWFGMGIKALNGPPSLQLCIIDHWDADLTKMKDCPHWGCWELDTGPLRITLSETMLMTVHQVTRGPPHESLVC